MASSAAKMPLDSFLIHEVQEICSNKSTAATSRLDRQLTGMRYLSYWKRVQRLASRVRFDASRGANAGIFRLLGLHEGEKHLRRVADWFSALLGDALAHQRVA